MKDEWNGSKHYRKLDIDPWSAMDSWLTKEEFKGFLKGCAIKRLARANSKGEELLDLIKARHEIDRAIELLQEEDKIKNSAKNTIDKKLKSGARIRRRGWPPGTYITLGNNSKGNSYLRNETGSPCHLTMEDELATDWEEYKSVPKVVDDAI